MKFMKKAMAFGIACVMGLTLAGCGSSTGNDSITVYSRDASSGTREAFEKANDMEEMLNLSYDEKHFSQLCQQQTFHKLSYKRIHFLLTTEGQPTLYKKLVTHSS